jgi:hypothetical protein
VQLGRKQVPLPDDDPCQIRDVELLHEILAGARSRQLGPPDVAQDRQHAFAPPLPAEAAGQLAMDEGTERALHDLQTLRDAVEVRHACHLRPLCPAYRVY